MPRHGDAQRDEVLQQVAVVAGDLDDQGLPSRAKRCVAACGVAAGVLDPGGGIGGEIGIVLEDLLAPDDGIDLHQQTLIADARMQGVARLGLGELLRPQEGIRQRHLAEIEEGARERRGAGGGRRAPAVVIPAPRSARSARACIGACRRHGGGRRATRRSGDGGVMKSSARMPAQRRAVACAADRRRIAASRYSGAPADFQRGWSLKRATKRSTTSMAGRAAASVGAKLRLGGACGRVVGRGARHSGDSRPAGRAHAARGGWRRGCAAPQARPDQSARTRSGTRRSADQSPPPMTLPARALPRPMRFAA